MSSTSAQSPRHRRFTPAAVLAGAVGSVALAASMTGTLSAFTASINNTVNTAAAGTLIMQEQNATGSVTCNSTDLGTISTNAATCATINKYGGSTTMVPGVPINTTISIKNTGTIAANTFTLTPTACTQTNNGTPNGSAIDFCTQLSVIIKSGTTTIFSGTAAGLATAGLVTLPAAISPVAPGTTVPITFTTTLAPTAGNTYQGLGASQGLTWTFTS